MRRKLLVMCMLATFGGASAWWAGQVSPTETGAVVDAAIEQKRQHKVSNDQAQLADAEPAYFPAQDVSVSFAETGAEARANVPPLPVNRRSASQQCKSELDLLRNMLAQLTGEHEKMAHAFAEQTRELNALRARLGTPHRIDEILARRHPADNVLVMFPPVIERLLHRQQEGTTDASVYMRVPFSQIKGGECMAGVLYIAHVELVNSATEEAAPALTHAFTTQDLDDGGALALPLLARSAGTYQATISISDGFAGLSEQEALLVRRTSLVEVPSVSPSTARDAFALKAALADASPSGHIPPSLSVPADSDGGVMGSHETGDGGLARELREVNGAKDDQEGQTIWVYQALEDREVGSFLQGDVPGLDGEHLFHSELVTEASEASAADRRYIVIELGSNDGKWIKEYLERHALDGIHFWPVIVEAQPVFKEALKNIAETHGGVYLQRAAWIKSGQTLTFHAHADAGGMGSSLFGDSVYSNGFCDGNVSCHFPDSATSMAQKYEVETVDVVELVQAVARPHDVVVLRMDIEGAEYEVSRRLITTGTACLLDFWEFEGHAMYAPSNYKYRAVDVVLPWLMRGCGVDMVTSQFYRVDPKLQKLREDMDARAAAAGVDVAACSDLWRGEGDERVQAWEGLGYNLCPEAGTCRGIPG